MMMMAIGRVSNGRMVTMTAGKNGVVATSKPIATKHAVKPVDEVAPALNLPPFMVKNNPVSKPTVKHKGQSFEDILKEQERIIRDFK